VGFGRQWQVYVEAEGDYRANLEHIDQFNVRNSRGAMVPLSALAHFETCYGPEFTMRYNLYRSAQIIGSAAPGFSSAQAMKTLEETFDRTMPREMGYDYMDMSFQEKRSQQGIPSWAIFTASLVFVFLILARAVRELVVAVQSSVEHADGGLWRLRGVMAAEVGDGTVPAAVPRRNRK
jgi:HAE1 family hydrophobic/amphiphilic exporter-1